MSASERFVSDELYAIARDSVIDEATRAKLIALCPRVGQLETFKMNAAQVRSTVVVHIVGFRAATGFQAGRGTQVLFTVDCTKNADGTLALQGLCEGDNLIIQR